MIYPPLSDIIYQTLCSIINSYEFWNVKKDRDKRQVEIDEYHFPDVRSGGKTQRNMT